MIPLNETLVHCRSRLLLSQNLKPAKYSQNICPTPCPKSPPENPSSTQACLEGSFWGAKSWGTGRYAQRGLPERNQLRFTSQKKWGFFYSKLQNVVWLIRAIINGNIIIQASISKRSHLNEYIFCLGAVAASEPLKRKEKKRKGTKRKETEEAAGVKPWRMRLKELSVGNWESRVPAWSQVWPQCALCGLRRDLISHLRSQENRINYLVFMSPLGSDIAGLSSTACFKVEFFFRLHL